MYIYTIVRIPQIFSHLQVVTDNIRSSSNTALVIKFFSLVSDNLMTTLVLTIFQCSLCFRGTNFLTLMMSKMNLWNADSPTPCQEILKHDLSNKVIIKVIHHDINDSDIAWNCIFSRVKYNMNCLTQLWPTNQ